MYIISIHNEFCINLDIIRPFMVANCNFPRWYSICWTTEDRCSDEWNTHSLRDGNQRIFNSSFVFNRFTALNRFDRLNLCYGCVFTICVVLLIIGYGNRYATDQCPEAIFIVCLQCIVGVLIQAFMVGTVFYKLARPIKRVRTLLFSRKAVIYHRDGLPCLMFRVGDMRKSHIIEAHIRAQIIRKKVSCIKSSFRFGISTLVCTPLSVMRSH